MYCKKCGSEIKEGIKFCSKCGEAVESRTDNSIGAVLAGINLKHDIKYYTGIAMTILAFIVSLFPLIYNPELSDKLENMNGNIFMLLKFTDYGNGIDDIFNVEKDGGLLLIIFFAGCVAVSILAIIAVINIVKSILNLEKRYDVSVEKSRSALGKFAAIGIVSLAIALSFNIAMNLEISAAANVRYSITADTSEERKEEIKELKKEYKEDLHDYADDLKYKISIAAVLLIVIGFGGIKLVDRFTYPYTRTAKQMQEKNMLESLSQSTGSGRAVNLGDWKCGYCGKINDGRHLSCVNCYHKK